MKKTVLKVLKKALETINNKKIIQEGAFVTGKEAYEIINKILLYRILEDKEFIKPDIRPLLESNYLFEPLHGVLYGLQQGRYTFEEIPWTPEGKEAVESLYHELRKEVFSFKEAEDHFLGDIYEEFIESKNRKSLGQFYTPPEIVEYIVEKALEDFNPVKNPYIKVGDIACGAGHFLVKAYDVLYDKFLEALPELKKSYGPDYWKKEQLHNHLLEHCIYGMDFDGFGVNLTSINLLLKDLSHLPKALNILKGDSLIRWEKKEEDHGKKKDFYSEKFDVILGNPPYVGHKTLKISYKQWLLKEYPQVFHDKSDLSYCFFERILENLCLGGKGMIITSRYFMESPTGKSLRKYLQNRAELLEIVDFYGGEIFKGLGVATAIYLFSRKSPGQEEKKEEVQNLQIRKFLDPKSKMDIGRPLEEVFQGKAFRSFSISQKDLKEGRWTLISKEEKARYQRIQNLSATTLREVGLSFQGIITGCDRAFIMKDAEATEKGIEQGLLKPWIKSRHVQKYGIQGNDQKLIYANSIEDPKTSPRAMDHIAGYRNRLRNRRECLRGIRPWHHLQWGRTPGLFEQKKIVFPYKSATNRFALDSGKLFCSADVYVLVIKDQYKNQLSLEYLLGVLNSAVYEDYFQSFGKNLGKGIYDYYPNSVMDLRIPRDESLQKEIETLVGKILQGQEQNSLMGEIDQRLGDYFGI